MMFVHRISSPVSGKGEKMDRIKVAMILPYFGTGGAEKMVAQLAAGMDTEKDNVEVFCVYGEPQDNHLEQMVKDSGVRIHFIGKKRGFSFSAMVKLFRELNAFQPDVVHTQQYACVYAALWPWIRKKPFLHTFHTLPKIENRRFTRRILTRFLVKRRIMMPVAISGSNQQLIADYYGLQRNTIPLVRNPVDVHKFSSGERPADDTFRFITVGRFSKEKNQRMMLHAFAELLKKGCDARLVMLGKGEEEENLRALARELGISEQIDFAGFVVNVEDYLGNADVFLLSSDYEALPLALLEAMAAGLPIISTDVGGVQDIVTDNGILISAGDTAALVQAMEEMYRKQDVRARMAAASRNNVRAYDVSNTVAGYSELYRRFGGKKN